MAKTFPLVSTSTMTPSMARSLKVLQRVQVLRKYIDRAAVFACRKVANSDFWSAHAEGKAADLMFRIRVVGDKEKALAIGRAIVRQATKKTIANRGRKIDLVHVIVWDRQWVRGLGWGPYNGALHNNHAHVAVAFSSQRVPDCAK